jgi:hypothetical protein
MLKLIKYYPVNWIDGMKLNREHFQQMEFALSDAVRDGVNQSMHAWNFGLLPGLQGPDSALQMHLDIDKAGLIRVRVDTCRAVTMAGARIELVNIPGQQLHASVGALNTEYNFLAANGKSLFVVLSVNPFERDFFGEPDPGEHPPRYPLTKPRYELHVIPQEQFLEVGPFHVPIAKLDVQNNTVYPVNGYIPPSTTMAAHHVLHDLCDELDHFYSQMEIHVSTIIQKIFQKAQKKDLAEMALYICERMMQFIPTFIYQQRWMAFDQAPLNEFARLAGFARVIKNALEVRSGSGREEFINYLTEWDEFNLQQGEFEALLNDLVLMEYNHLDIQHSVEKSRRFMSVMNQVFMKLAKLDYIGKREDPGIIVAQRTAQEAAKKTNNRPGTGGGIWLD